MRGSETPEVLRKPRYKAEAKPDCAGGCGEQRHELSSYVEELRLGWRQLRESEIA